MADAPRTSPKGARPGSSKRPMPSPPSFDDPEDWQAEMFAVNRERREAGLSRLGFDALAAEVHRRMAAKAARVPAQPA